MEGYLGELYIGNENFLTNFMVLNTSDLLVGVFFLTKLVNKASKSATCLLTWLSTWKERIPFDTC